MYRFGNIILVCFALLALTDVQGQLSSDVDSCPPHLNRGGYLVAYKNRCYDVVPYRSISWQDARDDCKKYHGTLVEIHDIMTLTLLKEYIGTLDRIGEGVWIGLHDKGHEGTWVWDSGAPVTFTHWGSDQPGGFFGAIDDCALMNLDGYWVDYPCDVFFNHHAYICQYDMIS